MPKYTCAVFDLDGTILDTLDDLTNAVNHAMLNAGHAPHSRETVRKMIGNGVRMLIARALGDCATESDIDSALADFRAFYAAHIDDFTREYPGVTPMLQKLRESGVRLCVCSNKYDAAVQQLIAAHFPGWFDAVVGEGNGIPRKPDPTGALKVISDAHADPTATCYIGDSGVDLRTARNASLPCISVTWGFADREDLMALQPDALCDSMDELTRAILGD